MRVSERDRHAPYRTTSEEAAELHKRTRCARAGPASRTEHTKGPADENELADVVFYVRVREWDGTSADELREHKMGG